MATKFSNSSLLPDVDGILEGLNVQVGLPDVDGIFELPKVQVGLPDVDGIFELPKVQLGSPDLGSILEGPKVQVGLPDVDGIFELPKVQLGSPDLGSILEGLNVQVGLPSISTIAQQLSAALVGSNVVDPLCAIPGNTYIIPSSNGVVQTQIDNRAFRSGKKTEPEKHDTNYFLPSYYSYKTLQVGFEFDLCIELTHLPMPIESGTLPVSSDARHWRLFCEFERRIRRFVQENLIKKAGRDWITQRVPLGMRERWDRRQEEERVFGRPVYDAIQYANFMDLHDLIVKRDNWREVFQRIFRSKEDIGISFQRLHPVRKALAHSRPLSPIDVRDLFNESTRIFDRLKIRWLQ